MTLPASKTLRIRHAAALMALAGVAVATGCAQTYSAKPASHSPAVAKSSPYSTSTSQQQGWGPNNGAAMVQTGVQQRPFGASGPTHSVQPVAFDPFADYYTPQPPTAPPTQRMTRGNWNQPSRPSAGFAASNSAMSIYGEIPAGPSVGIVGRQAFAQAEGGGNSMTQVSFALEGADFDPDISNDGSQVVFASTQHNRTADIYIKRIESRTVTQLTTSPANDAMPSFSPDGGRVAFASDRNGSWDIFVMSASGGQAVQLTSNSTHELHPSWSPDGKHLAFCSLGETSGRWELWVTEVDNPAVRRFLGYGLFPEWSPASDTIAFQRSRDRGDRFFSVWTIDYVNGEGQHPTEIASSTSAALVHPTWSPDGQRIAFTSIPEPTQRFGERPRVADIWICDGAGRGLANMTGGQFVNLSPTWGADHRVYFVSDRSGADNIWSIAPEQAIIAAGQAPPQNFAGADAPASKRSPAAGQNQQQQQFPAFGAQNLANVPVGPDPD